LSANSLAVSAGEPKNPGGPSSLPVYPAAAMASSSSTGFMSMDWPPNTP
jgi:hypothetical protein